MQATDLRVAIAARYASSWACRFAAARQRPLLLAKQYSFQLTVACVTLTAAGAENSYNLFVVRRNPDAATDEDRSRLEVRSLRCLLCRFVGGSNRADVCGF